MQRLGHHFHWILANKFQIENPETSYKDDCWTLFVGGRPPGDLKLAPAVVEGYESGGRYEC